MGVGPHPLDLPEWRPHTADQPEVMELGPTIGMRSRDHFGFVADRARYSFLSGWIRRQDLGKA